MKTFKILLFRNGASSFQEEYFVKAENKSRALNYLALSKKIDISSYKMVLCIDLENITLIDDPLLEDKLDAHVKDDRVVSSNKLNFEDSIQDKLEKLLVDMSDSRCKIPEEFAKILSENVTDLF